MFKKHMLSCLIVTLAVISISIVRSSHASDVRWEELDASTNFRSIYDLTHSENPDRTDVQVYLKKDLVLEPSSKRQSVQIFGGDNPAHRQCHFLAPLGVYRLQTIPAGTVLGRIHAKVRGDYAVRFTGEVFFFVHTFTWSIKDSSGRASDYNLDCGRPDIDLGQNLSFYRRLTVGAVTENSDGLLGFQVKVK